MGAKGVHIHLVLYPNHRRLRHGERFVGPDASWGKSFIGSNSLSAPTIADFQQTFTPRAIWIVAHGVKR